jgi:hypothetical protein
MCKKAAAGAPSLLLLPLSRVENEDEVADSAKNGSIILVVAYMQPTAMRNRMARKIGR